MKDILRKTANMIEQKLKQEKERRETK